MEHTELQEGIMVRCIQRVDEMLKNIRLAAKNLESKEFEDKLERASRLIRRDIVFSPSLYTSNEMISVYEEEAEKEKPSQPEMVTQIDAQATTAEEETDIASATDTLEDDEDELFTYNFEATEMLDEPINEAEQFNSNFL